MYSHNSIINIYIIRVLRLSMIFSFKIYSSQVPWIIDVWLYIYIYIYIYIYTYYTIIPTQVDKITR